MTTTTMFVEVIAVAVAGAGDLRALIAAIIDAAAAEVEHPPPVEYNSIPTRRSVIGSMIVVGSVGDARAYLMSNQRRSNLLRMRPERHWNRIMHWFGRVGPWQPLVPILGSIVLSGTNVMDLRLVVVVEEEVD